MDPVAPLAGRPPADRPRRHPPILDPPDLPAAARPAVSRLFLVTLLSAVDGSLLLLAAQGALDSVGGAVAVGLTVVAGAGSWLAARQAFGDRRLGRADWRALAALGVVAAASTVAAAWAGVRLATALTLHVLPKAAGVVLLLVAAEVAGVRLPRAGRVPLPVAVVAAALALEVLAPWIP